MFSRDQNNKAKQQSFISQMTSGGGDMQTSSMISMFSPRNLVKLISTTIDDYNYKPKVYKPDITQEHQFLVTFQQYWLKIQNQYKKYVKSKTHKVGLKQKQQRNQQIQLKLKLDKIPSSYFDQNYEFFFAEKFNKLSLKRKQDEVTQYLDEIELLLWNKTSKNPEKYFNCIDNFDETINIVQGQLKKVQDYRSNCHKNLMQVSKSQLKIKRIVQKKKKLQQLMGHLQSMKKLKSVRAQSQNQTNNTDPNSHINSKLQILENIKKKQLQIGSKIISLSKIVDNLQFYRQQIKSNIYDQFNQQVVQLMNKLLAYDKNTWENTKVSPQMLGKQIDTNNNPLEESRLNLTILDQSCFGMNDFNHKDIFSGNSNDEKIIYKALNSDQQSIKNLVSKLNSIWQAILKFDLYDQEEINELIMRQLVRHNVKWNKDLDEYLTKLFDEFQSKQSKKQQIMKPILEQEVQNEDDSQRSKEFSSTQQTSQQIEQPKNNFGTPKKNKYFSTITELTGMNDLKNLKDLNQLKKKTINTFKRFGNVKKIGEALGATNSSSPQVVFQAQSYCKKKQQQIPESTLKAKIQPQQKLSKVDTKFFLKAVKFYYEILSSLTKFIKENKKLTFFHNFLEKFYSFIEERVKYFFSLRNINEKTSVSDFLVHLNLIEYWCDVCDDVYENLSKLKSTIIDEYLTNLQKNALVQQLKKSIELSNYLPCSIASIHLNTFYYVFFWSNIQQLKRQQTNNMSLTIFKDEITGMAQQENMKLLDLQNLESQFKIIDKKIIYKKNQFFICQSFIPFIKQLEKYLQLREVLTQFNSNIQQKICEVVGFYVWYNLKNINKTGGNIKPRTLKNLCVIHSNIEFLKIIFTQQLHIQNKKYTKTLDQFGQFFKSLESNITMTPYLLIEQQISTIYQDNTLSSQFQIPCKQTCKILEIVKLSLQELKIYFNKEKIVKILQPTIKIIMKNYFGYLVSLGKRGLLEIKQFLPKFKQLLLNYGFKNAQNQSKQQLNDAHIFLKQLIDMQRNFKSKISQIK